MAATAARGSVEQRAGRIERHGGWWWLAHAAAARARGGHRVDGTKHVAMAVVKRDRISGADEVDLEGDHVAGEEALVELPGAAGDVDGAVLAHAAAEVLQEGGGERGLIESAAAGSGPRFRGWLADKPAMRGAVIVVGDEGIEAHLDVVERGQAPEVVEATGAQRAPEALMRRSA